MLYLVDLAGTAGEAAPAGTAPKTTAESAAFFVFATAAAAALVVDRSTRPDGADPIFLAPPDLWACADRSTCPDGAALPTFPPSPVIDVISLTTGLYSGLVAGHASIDGLSLPVISRCTAGSATVGRASSDGLRAPAAGILLELGLMVPRGRRVRKGVATGAEEGTALPLVVVVVEFFFWFGLWCQGT